MSEEEEEEVSEGDVTTAEPIFHGDDEVEDHPDVFLTFIYKGSKRGREADEAGGQSQRPRARPRYIPGM